MLFPKRWSLPLACMSTLMGVQIWHIKGNLDMSSDSTCDKHATVRWSLTHGRCLWHHWVDTTRPLNQRVRRMLFPKRWPLPLACRHQYINGSTDLAHRGHLDMSSTCDSAMAPWPWTVAMASLGRHHEVSRPAWESHVVPQTVAIATCMSTSMGVRIWHIEGILTCHQRATVRWHLGHGL